MSLISPVHAKRQAFCPGLPGETSQGLTLQTEKPDEAQFDVRRGLTSEAKQMANDCRQYPRGAGSTRGVMD